MEKIKSIIPDFQPQNVMADYEDAGVSALKRVWGDNITIKGCWFHFAQNVIKKSKSIGLTGAYRDNEIVWKIIRCIIALPLLPSTDIVPAINDVERLCSTVHNAEYITMLAKFFRYLRRQWIEKTSIGPERMSVSDAPTRTNNGVESYHAALKRRVKVAHPNLNIFQKHLFESAVDNMNDAGRLRNHLNIRRPKGKRDLMNDARIRREMVLYQHGRKNRLEFLSSVSHCADTLTTTLAQSHSDSETEIYSVSEPEDTLNAVNGSEEQEVAAADDDAESEIDNIQMCDVCLIDAREPYVFVPCGHSKFCKRCMDVLAASEHAKCPVCRAAITMIMQIFN
jgi:hypothetical protein